MYELLALAFELNKRPDAQVRSALGYAADLAVRGRQPHDLTRVADSLHLHGMDDRAGQLLDLAAEIDPSNPRPLLMSINLAGATKDPLRMGDTLSRLLALGWPGTDAQWRTEARKMAEDLASSLNQENRQDQASTLLSRLRAAESRDLFLRLSWAGNADLDLIVEEPLGASATVLNPRTVFGGALVSNGYGKHPEEIYVCPRAFPGTYKIKVETIYNDEQDPAREIKLEVIQAEGTPEEKVQSYDVSLSKPETYVVKLEKGRRTQVLPYKAEASPVLTIPATGTQPAEAKPAVTPTQAADALRPPAPTSPPR